MAFQEFACPGTAWAHICLQFMASLFYKRQETEYGEVQFLVLGGYSITA